jgi:thioesterase domain-containing protein
MSGRDELPSSKPAGGTHPSQVARGAAVPIRAQGSRPPLFVVHGAGGNIFFLQALVKFLGPDQPLYGIPARGLVAGERPHADFATMVSDYLDRVRGIQPHGPYLLGGLCIGGLIAFEMAQRLRGEGEDVALVVQIDPDFNRATTPWLYWRNPDALGTRVIRIFANAAWEVWLVKNRLARKPLNTGEAMAMGMQRRYASVTRALVCAVKPYRPKVYDGKVAILCSGERIRRLSDPERGWPRLASNLTVEEIMPTHREVLTVGWPKTGARMEALLQQLQLPPLALGRQTIAVGQQA